MSSKFWPDLALAPREHFFTAGSDTGDEGGADEDSEEALGRGEEGDEIDMDEEFEECGADSDNEDDEDDEEEEDIKEASGGKSKRVKHQRRVYIFGSVATLSIGQRKIEAKKLPRLVVTSTSFKGGAKKMISEMCRSLLKLKKGDSLKGNQDRLFKFSGLQLFRVCKQGSERLARKIGASNSSNTAIMNQLRKIDPSKHESCLVRLPHKYNGTVTFLSEQNAKTSTIRQKKTTIRVQVSIYSSAKHHQNLQFGKSKRK